MENLKHIKEYISTEDGTAGTLLIPQLIFDRIIDEANKALLPRELAALVLGPQQIKGPSTTINLETPNSLDVRAVGEGAEVPLDNLDFSTVTVTPKKYGVALRITKEMVEDSQFPLLQRNLAAVGRRFAEKETELILTALDGAANTVAGGAAITIANITAAIQNLHASDFQPTDILVGYEVLNDLQNIDTFVEAQKAGDTQMLSTGFKGNIYGLNVHLFSSNAAPTTTYAKYAYVLDRNEAYAIAIKRDITVENFVLPTYDMSGVVATNRISVHLLRSAAVCNITTA